MATQTDDVEKSDIKPALEDVMSGMKLKQQEQQQKQEQPLADGEEEIGQGTLKPQRYMAPQATPNMNAEAAQAAAIQFKKREKHIRKACAELDGQDTAQQSCCVIL